LNFALYKRSTIGRRRGVLQSRRKKRDHSKKMADHLASIYGTEKDKVNCSFFFKIGACRHGEKCSRKHVKPNFSQTILLPNLYQNPANLGELFCFL
jgi:hypothetical protein